MNRIAAAAAAIMLFAVPVAPVAASRLPVSPVTQTTFDVLPRGSVFEQDLWCTAGDHAARSLGARSTTRIYRISEPPRRAGQAVRFSLDPSGKASRTGLNVLGDDDGSLSVSSAKNQCAAARMMRDRR
jgi:hypothetical protein